MRECLQVQDKGSANNAKSQRVLCCSCDERSQGWRSAGVEPWMGSSTEKQLQRSTTGAYIQRTASFCG